ELARPTVGDLKRLGMLLDTLTTDDLRFVVAWLAALQGYPEPSRPCLQAVFLTDRRLRRGLDHLVEVGNQCDCLSAWHSRLLAHDSCNCPGAIPCLTTEGPALLRWATGIAPLIDDLQSAGWPLSTALR